MARVLQSLVLTRQGTLGPAFCSIEEYLGRKTPAYYDVLAEVGAGSWNPGNDARPWVRFCLTAHYRQARTLLRRSEDLFARACARASRRVPCGRAAAAVGVDTEGMIRLRRLTVVASFALAVALAAAACGSVPTTAGPPGGSGPWSTTPAPVPGAPNRPTGPTKDATLVRVVDGDTIRVVVDGIEERVRYIGMDTPELNTSSPATPDPYAQAATDANARLLAGGRLVLEKDVSERDRYGRLLRNVWVERDGAWTFVNLALVAEGYAQVSTFPPDVKYADLLLGSQRAAREDGRGLWGASPP